MSTGNLKIGGVCLSPRRGSSEILLELFLDEIRAAGISAVPPLLIREHSFLPCNECEICYDGSDCPLPDDANVHLNSLRQMDGIIIATPVFFYSVPGGAKCFIDRAQQFWVRRQLLGQNEERGLAALISVASSGGEKLFEDVRLVSKYFLDALGYRLTDVLSFRGVDNPKDITDDMRNSVRQFARRFAVKIKERGKSEKD